MRTSLARLERRRTEDAQAALQLMQRHFEDLAMAVLKAGRERGYLGSDPLGALATIGGPDPLDGQLCQAVLTLWQTFFTGFRPDELNFEAARFHTAAAELNERLQLLPEGEIPEAELALALVDTLSHFWRERQEAISQRLDVLIRDLGEHQAKLGSAALESAHQADELGRSTALVAATLQELGESVAVEDPLSDLLGQLIRRLREELRQRSVLLQERRAELDEAVTAQRDFQRALAAAAAGKVPTDMVLEEGAVQVVEQVADVVAGHREQEGLIKQLEQEKAQLLAELADKDHEIANRDKLIDRYEFEDADKGDEDRRLDLYRQAIALWESGTDPASVVARVRELERVLLLDEIETNQVMVVVDRHLEGLAKTLAQLRRIIQLTDDPKRYRPRLLGSGPYELKKLGGLMKASRDAARDLLAYVARARWAAGTVVLAKKLPRMRKIFKEMVGFVSDCRDKIGGPPAASLTMNLATIDGLASLPAVLAVDIKNLAKNLAKNRGAKSYLLDIVPLFDECVKEFHKLMEQARGEIIPRIEVPKRESGVKACERLADELLDLAGILDGTFAEARANGWEPTDSETRLIEEEHLLLMGLRDVDGAVGVLQELAGAPVVGKQPNVPSGRRSDLDGLLKGCRTRIRWLEDIARYRVDRKKAT